MNIVIWLLILISLGIIGSIIFRKFSVLANIDIENIESEKQAEVKRRIISNKLQRQVKKWFKGIWRILKPVFRIINNFFGWTYRKLWDLKDRYSQRDLQAGVDNDEVIEGLFVQAQDLWRREQISEAENKLIEIIGLDSKSFKAFQLLGELYLQKQNYQEAEQTFLHAVKLRQTGDDSKDNKDLANIHFSLSIVHQAQSDYKSAIDSLKQALEVDANNPRYLNKMIELCILIKDKGDAYDAYKKLEKVNPDNKKLKELKQRVTDL